MVGQNIEYLVSRKGVGIHILIVLFLWMLIGGCLVLILCTGVFLGIRVFHFLGCFIMRGDFAHSFYCMVYLVEISC